MVDPDFCESPAMFSTGLSAELEVRTPTRQSEPFDEASAWNERGGDSLTFSREPFDERSARRFMNLSAGTRKIREVREISLTSSPKPVEQPNQRSAWLFAAEPVPVG